MNVTVTLLAGGGGDDGAVEDEEHAATQKPRTNAVKSRIMIVPFRAPAVYETGSTHSVEPGDDGSVIRRTPR